MVSSYRICTKCVMDTSDFGINFDKDGICNHCNNYADKKHVVIKVKNDNLLKKKIAEIKNKGIDRDYDCIVGVSGGVDSSYVAYLAKKFGLKTLLVHLDNGWNSTKAVQNINNIVKYTEFDLYTLVIDWEEFRDLQRSFFLADVLDIELLTDHAINATVINLSRKHKVKYNLSGSNFATEAILPSGWAWRKSDKKNLKAIHKKFGSVKLKTFPLMSTLVKEVYSRMKIPEWVTLLNLIDYDKGAAIKIITKEMNWQYYGGKHYESIFTRFYQGYILPKKFGIDKRRAHLSTLINSGLKTREEALSELKSETYPLELQRDDFQLCCKKLGFTEEEMLDYIRRPGKSHLDYPSDQNLINKIKTLINHQ